MPLCDFCEWYAPMAMMMIYQSSVTIEDAFVSASDRPLSVHVLRVVVCPLGYHVSVRHNHRTTLAVTVMTVNGFVAICHKRSETLMAIFVAMVVHGTAAIAFHHCSSKLASCPWMWRIPISRLETRRSLCSITLLSSSI